jgi:hypothetical protein
VKRQAQWFEFVWRSDIVLQTARMDVEQAAHGTLYIGWPHAPCSCQISYSNTVSKLSR